MKDKAAKTLINIPVELSQASYDALRAQAGTDDPMPRIQAWTRWLLDQYASGGLMVSGAEVKKIETTVGQEVADGVALGKLALKGANRADGQYEFTVQIDPALIEPCEETARTQGVELPFFLNECVNTCLQNGWLYDFQPSGYTAMFSRDAQGRMEEFTGKRVPTGEDIVATIEKLATATK